MTIIMLRLTKKYEKEKFLLYANTYSKVKTIINVLLTCIIMFVLSNVTNWPKGFIKLGALILFAAVSTFDSYLIFRRIKELRQLDISSREYLLTYIKNTLIMTAVFLIFMQLKNIVKDAEDFLFIAVCIMSIWGYQYVMPYVLKATNNITGTELVVLKKLLLKNCPIKGKYKLYAYEGKKSKNANAVVVGTCLNRHIFVSDYFIENASQEEIMAILYHECGHIKNYDLEKRIVFLNVAMVLFYSLTCAMDYLRIGILEGLVMLLIFIIIAVVIYKKMQQRQELSADKFSVAIFGDKEIYIESLKKIYDINDMMEKRSSFSKLLSTHPQIQDRINQLNNI